MQPYAMPETGEHEPAEIYQRLVTNCPELSDLAEFQPHVEFLLRTENLMLGGRSILGAVHLPRVQGMLKGIFAWMLERSFGAVPDFLVILDADYWAQCSPLQREILIYHETQHMAIRRDTDGDFVIDDDTGRAKFTTAGHDVEEFTSVVRRYGAYDDTLRAFISAVEDRERRAETDTNCDGDTSRTKRYPESALITNG
jgi:Putative phage metallopeptidase